MDLERMISSATDIRELKRALSVQMRLKGMKHREISSVLGVRSSYISKWEKRYSEQGVEGLKLASLGSQGYLTSLEKKKIVEWIGEKPQRTLLEIVNYIEKEYQVIYSSLESYYSLLREAGMSWPMTKKIFELFIKYRLFIMPNLKTYTAFSHLI